MTCPVCEGSGRMPTPDDMRKYGEAYGWYGYSKDDDRCTCRNCGGQTMSGRATGLVKTRKDGTACVHEYVASKGQWNCTTDYVCKHCGDEYMIDSSG